MTLNTAPSATAYTKLIRYKTYRKCIHCAMLLVSNIRDRVSHVMEMFSLFVPFLRPPPLYKRDTKQLECFVNESSNQGFAFVMLYTVMWFKSNNKFGLNANSMADELFFFLFSVFVKFRMYLVQMELNIWLDRVKFVEMQWNLIEAMIQNGHCIMQRTLWQPPFAKLLIRI